MDFEQWMKNQYYLPPILRDFHDQKDLFKAIDINVQNTMNNPETDSFLRMVLGEMGGWTSLHIYVIDYFLWYMARRGYVLQKSQTRFDFIEYNPYKEWADKYITRPKAEMEE